MPLQRGRGPHPDRLELLGFVRHRALPLGHARYQERHVEATRQVTIGEPVGEDEHLVGGQYEGPGAALLDQRLIAVQCRDIPRIGSPASRPGVNVEA